MPQQEKLGLQRFSEIALPLDMEIALAPQPPQPPKSKAQQRDYKAERDAALMRRTAQLSLLRQNRDDATIGVDFARLAQFAILCALPYSKSKDKFYTRQSRLSNGSTLKVTFSVTSEDGVLPYGADRQLFRWLFNEALERDSPIIPWDNGAKYLRAMGMKESGTNRKDLRERFERIKNLAVRVERKDSATGGQTTVLETWHLPARLDAAAADRNVELIDAKAKNYHFVLAPSLWNEIKAHNVRLPRQLLLGLKGTWRVQDAILWLCYRLYATQKESGITWDQLNAQLPQDDTNLRRFRMVLREAVKQLKVFWPEAGVEVEEWGLRIWPSARPLVEDDPRYNRVRRLPAPIHPAESENRAISGTQG